MERYTVYETDNFLTLNSFASAAAQYQREREKDGEIINESPQIFPRAPLTDPNYLPWPVCQISRISSVLFDQCTITIHDVPKPNVLTLLAFKDHPIATSIKSITRSLKLPRAQSTFPQVVTETMTYKYFKCFLNDAGNCFQLYEYVWTKIIILKHYYLW